MKINPAIALLASLGYNFFNTQNLGKSASWTKKGPGRKHKQGR